MCGTDGKVWASTVWDPDGKGPEPELLVVGGSFGIAGDIFANHIAAWNGTSWETLGSGMNGTTVYALSVYNGELIAAGDFTTAGGVSANGIARWNGMAWQPLGTGISGGIVKALEVYGNELIAGGNFTIAGGVSTDRIARWDGFSWQNLGSGVGGGSSNPDVKALVTYNGELIVGGSFSNAGGVTTNNVARWNGLNWQAFPTGGTNEDYALGVTCLSYYAGELIMGGGFTSIGGVAGNTLARWNGSDWQTLIPNGSTISPEALRVYNNELIVAGGFSQVGDGVAASNIARWNGTIWQALDTGVNTEVATLAIYNGELIAGGAFTVTVAGGVALNRVARWNGASWQALNVGINNKVNTLGVFSGDMIAGGDFTSIGDELQAHGIARWNGVSWDVFGGGMNHSVNAVTAYGNELIAGGSFTAAGGTSVNRIARWDGDSWNTLGNGVFYAPNPLQTVVYALADYNGELIAGGFFSGAGGDNFANGVAAWNGTSWRRLDSGTGGPVRALAVYNNELIAGGGFESFPGGGSANYIAHWNGSEWQSLGGGVGGFAATVNALCVYNGELIVGGVFQAAGGVTNIGNIARWNGTLWQEMGSGMNNKVRALTVYNGDLFAGGDFTTAGGVAANRIARWDGLSWHPLTTGVSNWIEALGVYNNELIAGGAFNIAGGNISGGWARWGSLGVFFDCNTNGILDACEFDEGNSLDCNSDGIPDDCQQTGPVDSRWIGGTQPLTWSIAANWCQPLVPNNGTPAGNTYSVTIPGTTPVCTLDISPTISDLTIQDGGTLEVNADSGASVRTLVVEPPFETIQNDGTIRAKDAVRLLLDASDINQGATGVIEAVGQTGQASKIQINGRRVTGGTLHTEGDSAVIELLGGAALDGVIVDGNVVTSAATVSVPTGQTGLVTGTITNLGIIDVAQPNSSVATFLAPGDIGAQFTGSGCVMMQSKFARLGEFKGFIMNQSGHCVQGAGRIFGTFTNEFGGAIVASMIPGHPTDALTINAPGSKTNNGEFRANGQGTLVLADVITGTGSYAADGGTIDIPGTTAVTVDGSTATVSNGGTFRVAGQGSLSLASHFEIGGCLGLFRGCTPPVLYVLGTATVSVGGNLTMSGDIADLTVEPATTFELAGNFDNQCTSPMTFHWETGPLTMNGAAPQTFEAAGEDFGPLDSAGFIDNFALGTLRIDPGCTVDVQNTFDNIPPAGCEALYVDALSLGAGATYRLNGCNVYYNTLVKEPGATVILLNGAALMSTEAGDLDGDGEVANDLDDAILLVDLLLGGSCSPPCLALADVNGDGAIDGLDIALITRLLTGW